ncbi:hypothetical protein [Alkaliphilus peptidifermentans]|uniref:Multimeric flavodoxin WrbA n=1 Tax=Alkaliphilus peptidifermentans DSM 18978 TaxID=1120976 RepID=A0A1G5JR16_9FIRM|nr:hypothetical protein [Alkaliphilus peptidifermentans]SCY90767.1 hypothetical protein SAMN03080606_02987 [Alkaliphilus peptidifermentans DSM 18978]
MVTAKRLILINGSPRRNKTSYSFVRTIKMLSEEKNCKVEVIHTIDFFDGKNDLKMLKEMIEGCHIIGLIAPVYVDTLPYPTIWFLEELSKMYSIDLKGKDFFSIAQCGFPEFKFCQPLIDSCRFFAEVCKMNWLGGLGYGGGAILDGALFENLGKKGKNIIKALDLAVVDIIEGKKISCKPQELLTIKIPKFMYRPLAAYLNYSNRKTARSLGVSNIEQKAYLQES